MGHQLPITEASVNDLMARLAQIEQQVGLTLNSTNYPLSMPPPRYFQMMDLFPPSSGNFDTNRARFVRDIIRRRRDRGRYFDTDLFADPAWDILLDLYAAHFENRPVSVSSLCIAAAVPGTTALRWIRTMVDDGLLIRENDERDARRIYVRLHEDTRIRLDRYFDPMDR